MRRLITELMPKHRTEFTCDFCGKEEPYMRHCGICERDVCDDCAVMRDICDDDPDHFCPVCYILGEEYRKFRKEMNEKLIEKKSEWKENCKKCADKRVIFIPGIESIRGTYVDMESE